MREEIFCYDIHCQHFFYQNSTFFLLEQLNISRAALICICKSNMKSHTLFAFNFHDFSYNEYKLGLLSFKCFVFYEQTIWFNSEIEIIHVIHMC